MLFVKRFGNLRREHRLIFGKVRCDRRRHDWRLPLRRCYVLRRQSRSLILTLIPTLTLPLVLRDRFTGKQDRLIPRGRSVIVVATGTSNRRRSLESRVRHAASRTLAAVKAVVPWFHTRFVPRFTPCFASGFTAYFVSRFASNFAALWTCPTSAPVSGFATPSATTTASAKIARSARGVAGRFRRSCFRLFPLARYAPGFGKLPFTINRWTGRFQPGARAHLSRRTIRRDRFIQVFVLLFEIHEVGDVQKRVAFQPNVHKGRLHAWQHARYSALINRAR